jgi:hypothetical protein
VSVPIKVTLPDGSVREVPPGTTPRAVAEAIGPGLARAAVAAKVDGTVRDLDRPLEDDTRLAILTERDPEALDVLRHSAAHVLATAVRDVFPGAGIGFGPPIEDGFYYDFEVPRPFTPEDLAQIETKMGEVAKADYPFVREVVNRAEANRRFADDPLKLERISELGEDETITVYTDGPFTDLCRGPHVPGTGRLKHFKLLHAAGAYWRGDEKRQMLQRIYGTAWFKKEDLEAYLHRLEEARKRDHRRLGKELDLFMFHPFAPGAPFYTDRGTTVVRVINEYIREVSGGTFTAKDYRTWAATMAAALLLCALDHPGSERGCKRCVNEMLKKVASQLGHTPSVCRKSYIHPQVIDDFMSDRLATRLARQVRRQVREIDADNPIDVTTLRAVERAVARYLDTRRRQHA